VDPVSALVVAALVAAIVLCGFGIWAAVEVARSARELRTSVREASSRLVPLLEKTDVTVDAFNAELLRADAIITQFEEAGARVSHASGTLSDIVNAPAEIVSEVADRVRRAWKDRRRATEAVTSPATDGAPGDGADSDSPESDQQYQTED